MNKEQKQQAVKEIGEELSSADAVFAVDYRGISVPQAAELRTRLQEADASFSVVKNRLAKRATAGAGVEVLDEHLVGPTALTYIKGDAVIAAKAITAFIKEHQTLAYKGGIMDGKELDADGFTQIARLPGLETLHGQLVGLTASPLTGLVSALNNLIQGLALQLGQIAEQGLLGGDAPAAGEAPAEEAGAGEPEAAEAAGEPEAADEAAADAEQTSDEPEQIDEAGESDSSDDGDADQTKED